MSRLVLAGCRPEPLAAYLKALGVLRIVSEQADRDATGAWVDGVFVLESSLDRDGLLAFFRERYAPTPVITPWNGGSGFWPKDNKTGIDGIAQSAGPRFEAYRRAVAQARQLVVDSGLNERPDKDVKAEFVKLLRATIDDAALPWVDAALVFTADGLAFPPLLGTGGNDGRLDFANNFMQRLVEELAESPAAGALEGALFGDPTPGLGSEAIGQFFPFAAGGANAGPGFSGGGGTNPWDYVLLVEGAICFAAAVVRRLESAGAAGLAFPFTVRASAAGFGTAAQGEADGSRGELWVPLWDAPARWSEVAGLLREGRVRIGRRSVESGVDFARAVGALAVDRGVRSFARYAFHARNGLAFQAVPIGRWRVGDRPTALSGALDAIDDWLVAVRRLGSAPTRLLRAVRQLDDAIVAAARPDSGPRLAQDVLLALAEIEASAVDSRDHGGLWRPVPSLDSSLWGALDDGSPEYSLAASLSGGLRNRWSAVSEGARPRWLEGADRPVPSARVWRRGPLEDRLLALLAREAVEQAPPGSFDDDAPRTARLEDVDAFLTGGVDDGRLIALAQALSLLTWTQERREYHKGLVPSSTFAAARLVAGRRVPTTDTTIPLVSGWLAAAARDDGAAFTAATWRRLAASGVAIGGLSRRARADWLRGGDPVPVRRVAAACRFPLSKLDLKEIERHVTKTKDSDHVISAS